jgi:hyperosmotically inducible protein
MKQQMNSLCLVLALSLPIVVATGVVGCAPGSRYERSTGEYVDDKALNSRVRSALSDNPEYKFSDVSVTSFRGTVQLSGFVNSTDQKRKAGEIAEKVQGAKAVENNITVKDKINQ